MKKRRRGRVASLAVFLMIIGLNSGCEQNSNASAQRDGYNSLADCMSDWGSAEVCEEDDDDHRYFRGPTYFPGNRMANVHGQQFVPVSNRAVVSRSVNSMPSSSTSTNASYGGFGKTGTTVANTGGIGG